MAMLVIGLGNPDRGDDAAGVLVTRGLHGHRTKEVADCSELIDLWEGEESVIVVDAMRSGAEPGTVSRFDLYETVLPAKAFPSTHSFGLAETVELARALGRLPGELEVIGIEASGFRHGRRLTAAVKESVCEVIRKIEEI